MRHIILLLALGLVLPLTLKGQEPYQLFRTGVQYLYEHDFPVGFAVSPLMGIKVDESPCQTTYETVLPNLRADMPDCLVQVMAFPGSEICQYGAITQLNLQSDEDPLWFELRTQSPLGTIWLASLTMDSVFARVDEIAEEEFLGLVDSVKSIGFYSRDDQGQWIPLYEEAPLRVSRNYGLVTAVVLPWLGADVGNFDLVGMSDPLVGVQNPTREKVFTLESGDELHFSKVNTTLFPSGGYVHTYRDERATVVDQYWTADHADLVYVFSVERKEYYVGPDASTDTIYSVNILDTFAVNWGSTAFLDEQPGSIIYINDAPRTVSLNRPNFCNLPSKSLTGFFFEGEGGCLEQPTDQGPGDFFFEKLGGPYFANVLFSGFRFRTLKYANLTDGTVCGTPCDFIITNVSSVIPDHLKLWPNPAIENIYLRTPSTEDVFFTFNIIDSSGRSIKTGQEFRLQEPINISDLSPGNYWLLLSDTSGQLQFRSSFIKL